MAWSGWHRWALSVLAWPMAGICAEGDESVDGQPWAVGLSAHADDSSSSGFLASLNLGLGEQTWLAAAAGRSRSAADSADVVADLFGVAIDHRLGLLGVAFDTERWGDPDTIESIDFGASAYVQMERVRLGLRRERREIDIHYTLTGPLGRPLAGTAAVEANGTEVNLRVELTEAWQLHAHAIRYEYSRDVASLPRQQTLRRLGTSTLMLANSLVEQRATFGLEWEAGSQVVSLAYGRDESAVDGTRFSSIDAAVLFPIGARLDVEINVGKGRTELGESGLYGGVLLLIYGG